MNVMTMTMMIALRIMMMMMMTSAMNTLAAMLREKLSKSEESYRKFPHFSFSLVNISSFYLLPFLIFADYLIGDWTASECDDLYIIEVCL